MGVTPNKLNQSLTTFSLLPSLLSHVQQAVVLNTCSVRKFHGVYLPVEADNHQACHFTMFLVLYTNLNIPFFNPPADIWFKTHTLGA
jgi:hypothetical protein